MKQFKIIVEKHSDGYIAYPIGLKGIIIGEGDSYEEALADVKSAIKCHIETFGIDVLETDSPVIEAFIAEAGSCIMSKFPVDVPKNKVIKTLESFGFILHREREHIIMIRKNPDGTITPLTMPNHSRIKGSTLRAICNQSGISREDFINFFENL